MTLESYDVEPGAGLSVSFFVFAVALMSLIAAAAIFMWHERGEVAVVVAKREIPAFTQLTEDDLTTASVSKQGRSGGSGSVSELVGKYTRETVPDGQELGGEDVIEGGSHGIGEVQLQLHPDQADALDLSAGDEVRLWLSPSEESGAGLVFCARLLAIPETVSPADQTYVVGLSKRNAHRLVDRLGRSRLLITRPG